MFEKIDWEEFFESLKINTANFLVALIMIIIVLFVAIIAVKLLNSFSDRTIKRANDKVDGPRAKSIVTFMTVVKSIGKFAIYFLAVLAIINGLGFSDLVSNVVATAGIGALILTLGAQSIISDLIAGQFILFEKQYNVGDFIKINDEYTGTVLSLAMRCTYLQAWTGEKIIIPNGQIKTIVNYSVESNMAVVEVPTPYDYDSEKVVAVIKDTAMEYYNAHQDICLKEPTVLPFTDFKEDGATVTVLVQAKERNHIQITRDLRYAIKLRFDKEGIQIPFRQVVIHENKNNQ